jgi:hypothetical protein
MIIATALLQVRLVVRDRIELSTFRFSEGLSFPTPPGEY